MRYVAFHRAINTGDRRIKMADLRHVYVGLGYVDAMTYIATGNVIFTADVSPEVQALEDAFEIRFGFESEVFLRTKCDLDELIARIPWDEDDGVVEVSFLEDTPEVASARVLEATAVAPEQILVAGSEVLFLRAGKGIETTHKESTAMRILGMKMTRRRIGTIRRIHDRFLTEPAEGVPS